MDRCLVVAVAGQQQLVSRKQQQRRRKEVAAAETRHVATVPSAQVRILVAAVRLPQSPRAQLAQQEPPVPQQQQLLPDLVPLPAGNNLISQSKLPGLGALGHRQRMRASGMSPRPPTTAWISQEQCEVRGKKALQQPRRRRQLQQRSQQRHRATQQLRQTEQQRLVRHRKEQLRHHRRPYCPVHAKQVCSQIILKQGTATNPQ